MILSTSSIHPKPISQNFIPQKIVPQNFLWKRFLGNGILGNGFRWNVIESCFWVSKLVKSLFQPFIGSSVTYLHVFFSFWWVGILIMMFWSIRPYRNIEVLTNRSNVHWSKRALSLAPCARTCRGATCAITKGTNRPRLGVIASVRIHERTHYLVPVGLDGFALFQWVSVYFFKINITLKINHQFPGVGFSVKFPKFPTSVILPKAQHRSR